MYICWIYKKDAYQVHKHRNYTLKRSCVLGQCNVEGLNEVLRGAGLQNNNNRCVSSIKPYCKAYDNLLVWIDLLVDVWKPVADELLFLTSSRCRAAQSAADTHTCRCNWENKEG